jgi:hypothetical protein
LIGLVRHVDAGRAQGLEQALAELGLGHDVHALLVEPDSQLQRDVVVAEHGDDHGRGRVAHEATVVRDHAEGDLADLADVLVHSDRELDVDPKVGEVRVRGDHGVDDGAVRKRERAHPVSPRGSNAW